jgi:hypothetical protein
LTTAVVPRTTFGSITIDAFVGPAYGSPLFGDSSVDYNELIGSPSVPVSAYKCSFNLRLSMRIAKGARESLEVDDFVLLGELTPVTASSS